MHLTLESLHKAKETCSEIKSLEGLMNAEDRIAISEQLIAVDGAIHQAISTIDALNQMKGSLEACGYSEEWFDNVCSMGFKDLVEIDMPKFFDNKFNRQQVCMEGFTDTIKTWLKKAWELLKRVFGWLRDKLRELVRYLGLMNDNYHKKAAWAFDAIEKGVDAYLSKKAGVDLNNWYELEQVPHQIDCINALFELVGDIGFIGRDINASAMNVNTDEEMKHDLFQKLDVELKNKGIVASINNIYTNGFVLKSEKGNTRIVQFVTQFSTNWPTRSKLMLRSKDQIMALKDLLVVDLPKHIDVAKRMAEACDRTLKESISIHEDTINRVMTAVQPDQAMINSSRKYIIQANVASKIAVDAIAYLLQVNSFVAFNCEMVKKLAQAMQ